MIVDRRKTIAGLIGATTLAAAPSRAIGVPPPTILFVDSRRRACRSFISAHPGARVIDIAVSHAVPWAEVRAFEPDGAQVRGLTRWSDWVLIRGALQDKGLRVRAETQADPKSTGDGALFLWEMR
jgi:hypothetical protein